MRKIVESILFLSQKIREVEKINRNIRHTKNTTHPPSPMLCGAQHVSIKAEELHLMSHTVVRWVFGPTSNSNFPLPPFSNCWHLRGLVPWWPLCIWKVRAIPQFLPQAGAFPCQIPLSKYIVSFQVERSSTTQVEPLGHLREIRVLLFEPTKVTSICIWLINPPNW